MLDVRIDGVAEDVRVAEVPVREGTADVTACRPKVLRVGVQQIAVGDPVAVHVRPRAHALRDPARRIREGIPPSRERRF